MKVPIRVLQYTAIGDAVGAGYEYVPQHVAEKFKIHDGFAQHAKHTEVKPGMWTDDTMMSVAVADALLAEPAAGGYTNHASILADAMVAVHRRHYTVGYSSGMLAALNLAAASDGPGGSGKTLRYSFDQYGRSESNGSAMRSAVYGILPNTNHVVSAAEVGAGLTHRDLGIEGAVVVALVSHYMIHQEGTRAEINDFLVEMGFGTYTVRQRERVAKSNGPLTFLTVTAALTALRESETYTEILEKCVRIGGDVDTVAAIAMGLAGSCPDYANDLPTSLLVGITPVAGLTWDMLGSRDQQLRRLGGLQ